MSPEDTGTTFGADKVVLDRITSELGQKAKRFLVVPVSKEK